MNNRSPYIDKLNSWSSHSRIARMLEGIPIGARVLDVGAGSGTLARICAQRGYVMRGIEPSANWLGDARSLYADLYEGSLEQTPDDYLSCNAAVICGDVLEHLVQPEEQLQRLVQTQSPGCVFIISVPNIANVWVRLNLLFGRFDYSERGILDRTHLHFYTRKSFIKLVMNAGLDIQELASTPVPVDLALPHLKGTGLIDILFSILVFFTRLWPSMLAYQWIAKATISNTRTI